MLGFQIFWTARRTLAGKKAIGDGEGTATTMPTPSRIRRSSATMPRQRHYLARLASPRSVDEGFIALGDDKDVDRFVTACRMLRFWKRGEQTKRM